MDEFHIFLKAFYSNGMKGLKNNKNIWGDFSWMFAGNKSYGFGLVQTYMSTEYNFFTWNYKIACEV